MALVDDLRSEVRKIFRERWSSASRGSVPESVDLELRNDAVRVHGAVLYADLDGSTELVDTKEPQFAAEIYKTYLVCAARIIESEGGAITAYDGDRIMAVYTGRNRHGKTVRSALKLNFAVSHIINPAVVELHPETRYVVRQSVGIDASELFVARTGIRGANDLVWVGRAANHAAKLSARSGPVTQITSEVYERLEQSLKVGDNRQAVWSQSTAPEIGNRRVYTSDFFMSF